MNEKNMATRYTGKDLHFLVSFVLGLWILFSSLAVIGSVAHLFHGGDDFFTIAEIVVGCITIYGLWLIINAKKRGVSLFIFTRIANMIIAWSLPKPTITTAGQTHYYASSMQDYITIMCVAQIIILFLLLLLRKNGRSGYDVLWERK